jgi:hypothetical protein
MDIEQLYQDFSIYALSEGHKHCRPGYINTECPYCTGNPGLHLSYNLRNDYFICWRCGWHPTIPTIAKLINVSDKEAYEISKKYGGINISQLTKPKIVVRAKSHRLPDGSRPLADIHKQYLEDRNFDPDYLEKEWNLLGTGPYGMLDDLDYRFRIIIPFIWNGEEVSFDSRDITGKRPNRYQACPEERELVPHKSILYGKQDKWGSTGICVEGPTDVWRFGFMSCATSGIKYTNTQIRVLAKTFKRVAVAFDDDPQAIVQADKLVAELKFRNVDAFRVPIEGDPGGMKQKEADYLVKQIIK